jgi:hypothetical protein
MNLAEKKRHVHGKKRGICLNSILCKPSLIEFGSRRYGSSGYGGQKQGVDETDERLRARRLVDNSHRFP